MLHCPHCESRVRFWLGLLPKPQLNMSLSSLYNWSSRSIWNIWYVESAPRGLRFLCLQYLGKTLSGLLTARGALSWSVLNCCSCTPCFRIDRNIGFRWQVSCSGLFVHAFPRKALFPEGFTSRVLKLIIAASSTMFENRYKLPVTTLNRNAIVRFTNSIGLTTKKLNREAIQIFIKKEIPK